VANLDEKLLLRTIIFMIIFFMGGLCNFLAIQHNEGKMPVLLDLNYTDDTHLTYQNPFGVNMWILSDIFYTKWAIFSIGDVLLVIGAVFVIYFLSLYWIRKKIWKKVKLTLFLISGRDFYQAIHYFFQD